ncbi:hypothetical protein [Mucilaginibacter sp. L3T2-6]|uniref:hypothetical protein n=1 Tax=Mucilaginibacter sp. L3T2-6 TaxID=3062491 RepID=UPI002675CCE6|nr:hypothetical protein [Mucilaginibacter sp. L3T2-6]MDO3641246.1 hypothetical protein [Mucilaginibacter sp. L3T2-6]MDV6213994.1 hypothetical protein [Mucilaginibacter sp. L3T2-6]
MHQAEINFTGCEQLCGYSTGVYDGDPLPESSNEAPGTSLSLLLKTGRLKV